MARGARLYTRVQGKSGQKRYYGDFREFADVGGGQEALVAPDMTVATTDRAIAEKLAADRVIELIGKRRMKGVLGVEGPVTLEAFASSHLVEKNKSQSVSTDWLKKTEVRLRAAVEFFGHDRILSGIRPKDVSAWIEHLRAKKGNNGSRTLSNGTVRHYLNALSNLYLRAASEGAVPPGYNPVRSLIDKPVANPSEARWLEVNEAARVLEAAKAAPVARADGIRCLYAVVATLLLTGGRAAEVLGLEVGDINFERKTVTFRPNNWRGLKNRGAQRAVPLWPQLDAVLREYVALEQPKKLLFPSGRAIKESMITDLRKALRGVAVAAELEPGSIGAKVFRHTYCSARLQTLDGGHPVSTWTVAKEMGHRSTAMIERTYGHLGEIRARSEEVRYGTIC